MNPIGLLLHLYFTLQVGKRMVGELVYDLVDETIVSPTREGLKAFVRAVAAESLTDAREIGELKAELASLRAQLNELKARRSTKDDLA